MERPCLKKCRRLPEFREGKYRLLYDLSLREGPGLQTDRRAVSTPCGRCPGILPAGVTVCIDEIKYLSVSVWGRCELGWLCIFMNDTYYAIWRSGCVK